MRLDRQISHRQFVCDRRDRPIYSASLGFPCSSRRSAILFLENSLGASKIYFHQYLHAHTRNLLPTNNILMQPNNSKFPKNLNCTSLKSIVFLSFAFTVKTTIYNTKVQCKFCSFYPS